MGKANGSSCQNANSDPGCDCADYIFNSCVIRNLLPLNQLIGKQFTSDDFGSLVGNINSCIANAYECWPPCKGC